MIGKAKSCIGGTALFNYVVNEKKGYELFRNGLSGGSSKELYQDMIVMQQQNRRCTNNTISIVLSPTIQDSKIMSDRELKMLTKDFLIELNLEPDKNQFIAFVHTEKDHKHIHILMNRVKEDGKLLPDKFIGKKAQSAAHKVAMEHGWTSVKNLKDSLEQESRNQNKEIKKLIKEAHIDVLKSKPKNLQNYIELMAQNNIIVLPTINRQGNIQGYRFFHEPTGVDLKASEVDRNINLSEIFKENKNSVINEYISLKEISKESKMEYHSTNSNISLSSAIGDDLPEQEQKKRKKFKR